MAKGILSINSNELHLQRKEGRLEATADYARVSELDAVLICVTTLNGQREPDLSYVLDTARSVAPHYQRE